MTQVLLSIGSNQNEPEHQIGAALASLRMHFENVRMSSLYLTEPVGGVIQAPFINAGVVLETQMNATQVLDKLMLIEQAAHRERHKETPNGPRNLDLDIILFGDAEISESGLTIPHPRFRDRRFVLEPLNEIAPGAVDPTTGKNIQILLNECKDTNWVKPLTADTIAS